jgi:hypothetical protein
MSYGGEKEAERLRGIHTPRVPIRYRVERHGEGMTELVFDEDLEIRNGDSLITEEAYHSDGGHWVTGVWVQRADPDATLPELEPCPSCHHPHMDYSNEPCVSCGCDYTYVNNSLREPARRDPG